jgi:hypothetical protein
MRLSLVPLLLSFALAGCYSYQLHAPEARVDTIVRPKIAASVRVEQHPDFPDPMRTEMPGFLGEVLATVGEVVDQYSRPK